MMDLPFALHSDSDSDKSPLVDTNNDDINYITTARSQLGRGHLPPELDKLYKWLDTIPFHRAKKNVARDFSDASMCAELLGYFLPGLVEMHNYPVVSNTRKKAENWEVLKRKVLRKLHCPISQQMIQDISTGVEGAIEQFLLKLKVAIERQLRKEDMHRAIMINEVIPPGSDEQPLTPGRYHLQARLTVETNTRIEELIREKKAREDEIKGLRKRVGRMERLLKQKDDDVLELTNQLERMKKLTLKTQAMQRIQPSNPCYRNY